MKLVEKKYLVPFVAITSLFALWGFANEGIRGTYYVAFNIYLTFFFMPS